MSQVAVLKLSLTPPLPSVNTILLAKPEKGAQLEGMLVNMARSGQIQQRLTEPELVGLLERVSDSSGGRATGKVKVGKRREKGRDRPE